MLSIAKVCNHLEENGISIKSSNSSNHYLFSDEIILNEKYSLEITFSKITLYYKNNEVDEFTSLNESFTNRIKSIWNA